MTASPASGKVVPMSTNAALMRQALAGLAYVLLAIALLVAAADAVPA